MPDVVVVVACSGDADSGDDPGSVLDVAYGRGGSVAAREQELATAGA